MTSAFVLAAVLAAPPSIHDARVELRSDPAPAAALDAAKRERDSGWIGWSVPAVAQARDVCCFNGRNFRRNECSLADRENSWGTTDDTVPGGTTEMFVLVETKGGAPSRARIVSPSCPVDGANRPLIWMGQVESGASLTALGRLLEPGGGDDLAESALAAIAYHADPHADALIERRALDRSSSTDTRQQAIFWAGHARGEAGYKLVERILSSDPSRDIRQHAIFALTESSVPGAADRIKRAAVEDRDGEVRAQALFWLAQMHAEGAGEWIVGRLDAERDEDVREQAVFALTQLPDGTDWLLKILRSKRDPDTIRRALFWLGQSEDPRALEEIEKILAR